MRARTAPLSSRPEDCEAPQRVALLGLADRSAVDEPHAAERVHPRLVGVAEREDTGVLGGVGTLVEAGGLVLEQIFVDLARGAVSGMPRWSIRAQSSLGCGP
jgi:hypothetical protein